MPQQILPLIPRGATQINGLVSVFRDDAKWTYFLSTHPVYSHKKDDHRMFRMVTSQLVESGACRQIDIQRTFGVSKSSVIRSVNKLRSGGAEAFFTQRKGRRGGSVFTCEVLEQAQRFFLFQVVSEIQRLTTPPEVKIERVRVSEFLEGSFESEEQIKKAVARLQVHLLKLLDEGIKIVVE